MEDIKNKKFTFAAINPYMVQNMVDSKELEVKGKEFISWGSTNTFPQYLYSLYDGVSTLHSIIEGTVDYISGDGVINDKDGVYFELIRCLSRDLLIYGGFCFNVLRNKNGEPVKLSYVDFENIRANEDNTVFYYSKDWNKSFGRVKTIELPVYRKEETNIMSSLYYYKSTVKTIYPTPLYVASLKSCEIAKKIADFHLNGLSNGFSASYLISFNNGVPTDTEKEEIEEYFNDKFGGSENSGSIVFSFADDKEHSAELSKLDVEDFGTKYESLRDFVRQDIFTAFRANPILFGIDAEHTGFNSQEYAEAFLLYNRTMVRPKQILILNAINSVMNSNITIIPFTLEENKKEE